MINIIELTIFHEINHQRILRGLEPLLISSSECDEARHHSRMMAVAGKLFASHIAPSPTVSSERRVVVRDTLNVQVLASRVLDHTIKTDRVHHAENILSPIYVSIAIGISIDNGNVYVTMRFFPIHTDSDINSLPDFKTEPKKIMDRWSLIEV